MALTPVPIIDPGLGDVPDPADDEAVFEADAYDFTSRMPGFGSDIKAIGDATYANAQWAETKASEAAASASNASNSESAAALSEANAAQSETNAATSEANALASEVEASKLNLGAKSSEPTLDNQGDPLRVGAVHYATYLIPNKWRVWSGTAWEDGITAVAGVSSLNGLSGPLTLKTVGGQTLIGSGDIGVIPSIARSSRTSNTIIGVSDKATWIDVTSGTFTQTFSAASTLGPGFWLYMTNSGTGELTLDPSGAELIDGLSSYIMYPGETRLIQCDGLSFSTIVVHPFYKQFTSSGVFLKPPGYRYFGGLLWSAGASGGKGNGAGGGGGGGCIPFAFPFSSLSSSESVTIGAGGAAQSAANSNGFSGGNSVFSSITVYGGAYGNGTGAGRGGTGGGTATPPIDGTSADYLGAVVGSYYKGFGFSGGAGYVTSSFLSGKNSDYGGGGGGQSASANIPGGSSIYGGGGGGCAVAGALAGGSSVFGGAGGSAVIASSGQNGVSPAGGGGATSTGASSGAGASGELRIWGVI